VAVYVDREEIHWKGRVWCHLVADSLDELHSFAARLGLKKGWFQSESFYPHYDVTLTMRARAIRLGALSAGRREVIGCCKQMRRQMQMEIMQQLSLFDSGESHGADSQTAADAFVAARIRPQGKQ
jgi:hypothetical protein